MDQLLDLETLKKLTPEQQQQVIAGVKQQAAIANAQNLITVSVAFLHIICFVGHFHSIFHLRFLISHCLNL
ncbi:unnamed protein product [Cylicostephanus goldi]|uniref:Uncharacterized protein n=1 Tax=Cylicostephanus goldi TaxID=71465 RepID=A0A3P6TBP3_CYLGO|nr:unnamed protein product [Cylicostephanus goldi]